jgi:hypothetical protein
MGMFKALISNLSEKCSALSLAKCETGREMGALSLAKSYFSASYINFFSINLK